jgi:hypothetical protein
MAEERAQRSEARAQDAAVNLDDGPAGGGDAGPEDIGGRCAFGEGEDADDGDDARASRLVSV